MPYAGEVEICPCLAISFRDKLHMVDKISRLYNSGGSPLYHYDGVFKEVPNTWQALSHDCTFEDHPVMNVEVKIIIRADRLKIFVQTQYVFNPTSDEIPLGIKSPLMSPQKDTATWLGKFFDEAGSSFSGWHSATTFSCTILERHSWTINFTRCLGDEAWPNKDWNSHRRN
jgi:hypothetical protein